MIWQDDMTAGMEFPNATDRARVKRIQDNRMLWQAKHEEVFTRIATGLSLEEQQAVKQHWAGLKYVCVNLLGLLSRDTAEHLSLEPSTITGEESQDNIDTIRDESMWDSTLADYIEECSALGEIGLKVYDGKIDSVSPDLLFRGEDYFSFYADQNIDPRKTIAPMAVSIMSRGDDHYVLFEIHEAGYVIWRAYQWNVEGSHPTFADKGTLGREVDPKALVPMLEQAGANRVIETGIDEPTLMIVQNEPCPEDRRHGRSDYTTDLKDLQGEFEDKLSVTLRHFHELVNGGITILPTEAQAMVQRRGGKTKKTGTDFGRGSNKGDTMPTIDSAELNVIFEDAQSRNTTRHVARASQYEGGLQSLQLIISCFETVSNMTIDNLLTENAAPESGRAMRLARYNDIKRVKRKAMRLARKFAHVYELALMLEKIEQRVTYVFPEPYPLEEMEKIEAVERATQKPFMTVETALTRIMNWSTEAAENEASELRGEQHAAGFNTTLAGAAVRPGEIENA